METSSFGALGNFGCLGFVVFLAAILLFAVAEGKIDILNRGLQILWCIGNYFIFSGSRHE